MFTCRQFVGALCDCMDGVQDKSTRAKAERHLSRCGKCRIVVATTRQTVTLYRKLSAVSSVPAEVEARIFAAIERCGVRRGKPA